MQEHDRFEYSPISQRAPLKLPNGARVAVWVIPNIEHFLFDRPSTWLSPVTTGLVPDVLNYSRRDYGPRVGYWRMLEVLSKHGVRATAALVIDITRLAVPSLRKPRRNPTQFPALSHASLDCDI